MFKFIVVDLQQQKLMDLQNKVLGLREQIIDSRELSYR